MKKLLSTLAGICGWMAAANAQLVISEISFNPPESGTDSLEFIEIYNAGSSAVDMQGYYLVFANSMRDSFSTSLVVPAGGFVVTAVNDSAVYNQFNMSFYPRQWRSASGLSNSSGTTIRLHNSTGSIIDSVAYLPTWISSANGNGASMILCNAASDNNVSTSWGASSTATGHTINSKALMGSPGVWESCVAASYPLYTIDQINGTNANGVADSANILCEIRGIVHSGDFRGGAGYDFALINSNGVGITVYKAADLGAFVVNRGDSLHLRGRITQYNGLLQFEPDSITVAATGQTLVTAATTTVINETTENKLVALNNVVFVDTFSTGTTGTTIRVVNPSASADTFYVRFDADTDLLLYTLSCDTMNITGVGRQNDATAPYDSLYTLLVRDSMDIDALCTVQPIAVRELANNVALTLFPVPAQHTLNIQTAATIETAIVTNALGQVVNQYNNINTSNWTLNVSSLPAGMYQVSVVTNQGKATQRFVVTR